ncbi:MAG TPA: cupin domain-containing protein [Candidatus Binataceae bacterium]|nr:cupin domain-containing protein [Candidatus Binataceae bacterium]
MIETGRRSQAWQSGDRTAIPITRNPELNVTLLLLRAGARLSEHHAQHSITVQVLSGTIAFAAGGATHELGAGMLCMLDPQVPHAVEARAESAILLTAVRG